MKKNSILKVLLLSILVVSICTWIFPTIEFNQQLNTGSSKSQIGVFDLFAYLVEVVRYFPYLIILTLSMGAFYGVAYRIPAYRALLDKLVEKFGYGLNLPITSFGNLLVSAAYEGAEKYGFYGIFSNMLTKTSAGITSVIVFSLLMTLIAKPRD